MIRKIAYWSTTGIAAVSLLMALTYLTGSEQVVSGFTRSGYPQHLRIVLGIAKPLAAYAIGEPAQIWSMPLALLVLLSVSYVTRPANRRVALAASW